MISHSVSPAPGASSSLNQRKVALASGLITATWLLGAVGHFTRLIEWPALLLYVSGALGLTWSLCSRFEAWQSTFITRRNLNRTLRLGALIGGALVLLDLGKTYVYYRMGGAPMAQAESLLIGFGLIMLFPLLIVAEEFLWRGLLLSALLERGLSQHIAVAITTLLFTLNHLFVAPVGLTERGMLAMMALPLGLINGYLAARTHNLWGGVLIHGLTALAMAADILILPGLV